MLRKKQYIPPIHIPPKLHKDTLLFSFENQWEIKNIYKEILGLYDVDHFSINIVNQMGDMTVISSNASIVYNIFQDGSYLYNGSISPTYYEKMDFFIWEQCFDRRFYQSVKDSLQSRNGIYAGIVMVYRSLGYHILFSFATKSANNQMLENAIDNNINFLKMGFYCFNLIKQSYSSMLNDNNILKIKSPNIFKPLCGLPNLKVVK